MNLAASRCFVIPLWLFVSLGFLLPTLGIGKTRRSAHAWSLKQISQATLVYAFDHNEALPHASDVWDYAGILAENAGINDARIWQSKPDPALDATYDHLTTILISITPNTPCQLNPTFRAITPSFAVALGSLNLKMPPTTPIAWTRGLQPDGTWADHGVYGSNGGYIAFLDGSLAFYRNLTADGGELVCFDGKGKTSNILEALPPGTRIGEYLPTTEDKIEWARRSKRQQRIDAFFRAFPPALLLISAVWIPFIPLSCYRLIKKKKGAIKMLLWPLALSCLLLPLILKH